VTNRSSVGLLDYTFIYDRVHVWTMIIRVGRTYTRKTYYKPISIRIPYTRTHAHIHIYTHIYAHNTQHTPEFVFGTVEQALKLYALLPSNAHASST
jgi:hypothetical protein